MTSGETKIGLLAIKVGKQTLFTHNPYPRDDLINLLKDSKSDFMYDLFEGVKLSSESGGRGKKKAATVSSQFKESLTSLMQVT